MDKSSTEIPKPFPVQGSSKNNTEIIKLVLSTAPVRQYTIIIYLNSLLIKQNYNVWRKVLWCNLGCSHSVIEDIRDSESSI